MSEVAYFNFLITGPDNYAANAETEREALALLADALDSFARNLEMRLLAGDPESIRKMRTQAKRVRATNPVTARFPKRYRFQTSNPWNPGQFFDFAAERNMPREES